MSLKRCQERQREFKQAGGSIGEARESKKPKQSRKRQQKTQGAQQKAREEKASLDIPAQTQGRFEESRGRRNQQG